VPRFHRAFRGLFSDRFMPAMGFRTRALMVVLALVAGVTALETALAFRTGALGIPGLFLVRVADVGGAAGTQQGADKHHGGESVMAKLPEVTATPKPAAEEATGAVSPPEEPAAKEETGAASPRESGERRLEGLGDIPLKPWISDEKEPESGEAPAKPLGSQATVQLPWDAVEPVPFDPATPAPSQQKAATPETPPASAPAFAELPAEKDIAAWVKAKASEIKGHERARPLYHFEFWVEPPQALKGKLAGVTYEFNTPAVMPQSQVSYEEKTGFRVRAGGLVCADKVTVTVRFRDGRARRVEVDGCKLVS
jgi:hypothetical protein